MAAIQGYLAHHLFTEECLKEFTENFNFTHVECLKSTMSKMLGLTIIASSFLVKVPQIMKILNNKSAKGISVASVLLELFAVTAMASYSFVSKFPFSSWGDILFLGIQSVTVACLVVYYSRGATTAMAFLSAYIGVIATVVSGMIPLKVLWFAQAMNILVLLTSKTIQAYANYSNGSTGQLSAVTVFLLFFMASARIFTSIQETGDAIMIAMFSVSAVANAVIALQLLYYWNAADKKAKKARIAKKKK